MTHKLPLILLLFQSFFTIAQEDAFYFQQEVNYEIRVELDDRKHELNAFEQVTYINHSDQPIHSIYFHLWPNAYRSYQTALCKQKLEEGSTTLYHAPESLLGYIDGLEFKTDDQPLEWDFDHVNQDICQVQLLEALKPGESVVITTPFHVKLPEGIFSRMGHLGESYQITQWYPKPAVLDKDGWHAMPYLDQGEFYSEYGTFDVYITLPENYVVGATGDLTDCEQEVAWLTKKAEETQRGIDNNEIPQYLKDVTTPDLTFPASSDKTKTLHYHQERVHDFAWFADKRYHVLKGEVELPHSKEKVTTWAMFTNNEGELWKNSLEYLHDAVYYYSLWNGDYPYKQVTAVDGALSAGGGMEYPNVTVIGESGNDFGLETVIMHEVGHNWFYGILGSNERDHAWMDEGLNSMNENRYIETKYPDRKLIEIDSGDVKSPARLFDLEQYTHKATYELAYLANATRNRDQPIDYPAGEYTSLNYGGIVYSKTALVFDYLMAYLGEELYDKCMQRYFNEWKFRHPQPDDLRKIFEEETGKDLTWFFDDLIKTTKKLDYKIVRAKKDTANPENVLLKIRNRGINGPFSVSGVTKDGEIVSTQWYEPIGKKEFVSFPKGDFYKYRIDARLDIPEVKRKNNNLQVKGLFKTTEPLRFQLLGSVENPDKTQLFFTPVAGWNMNDKGMIGMAFYNSTIPFKKFEYVLAPLYAPNSENINGYASAYYHIMPKTLFSDIAVGASSASFSYLRFNTDQNSSGREILEYYKVNPNVTFTFKKKRARQFSQAYIKMENINIFEEKANYAFDSIAGAYRYNLDLENFYVNRLTVGIGSKHPINPFGASMIVEQAKDFVKLNLEANYYFAYKKRGTGLGIRVFIGSFLYNDYTDGRFEYSLSGNSDYTYDNILLARNTFNTFLNQQLIPNDGGFKQLTTTRTGDRWIRSINIKSNLFTRMISAYGDFGITGYTDRDYNGNEVDAASEATYNMGLSLNIVPNIFEVYFPVYMSSDLNQLSYGEKIRFVLNISNFNPFKFARSFDL
ncbi:MAG: M1 family metallopeptidase [Flavobacteriales bacterium]|nr:M1 family metallopeptidase [Flavobacteriales bacterium]